MIINNQVVTTYIARAGNVVATMGQIEAGLLRVGRAAQMQGTQVSNAERQMRAFGTTIRYAFAGAAVFGVVNLTQKLSQLQQQIGLISAISGPAGVNLTGQNLVNFVDQLRGQTVSSLTPLDQLTASAVNFLSTVQGAKRSEIPDIVGQIGRTAQLSQTPVEDLTKTVTTMNIAFGRSNNLRNINALLREWFGLISTAPGGIAAAPQIAQQIGPLAAVGRLGRATPEQTLGLTLSALRFGATPSTALRGLQYFLQSVLQPTTPGQKAALARAGVTAQTVAAQGAMPNVMRFLRYLRGLGVTPSGKQLGEFTQYAQNVDDPEGLLAPNMAIPGLSAQAITYLRTAIGRIHGIRTAIVLASQLERGNVSSIMDNVKLMRDYQNDQVTGTKSMATAWKRLRDQAQLKQAAIAIDTLQLQMAQALAPIINIPARGIVAVQGLAQRHKEATRDVALGGAAFLAAMGISRALGFRPFGALFGRLGLGGRGAAGFERAKAIEDAMKGGLARGDAPQNPLYVVIVGPPLLGPGFGGGPPTKPLWRQIEDDAKKVAGPGGGFLAGLRAAGARVGLGAGAGTSLLATAEVGGLLFTRMGAASEVPKRQKEIRDMWNMIRAHPRMFPVIQASFRRFKDIADMPKELQPVFNEMLAGKIRPLGVERLLEQALKSPAPRGTPLGDLRIAMDDIVVEIDLKDTATGKVEKHRVHIPANVYQGGRVPSTRGKRKSIKTDFPRTTGGK